MFQKRMVDLIKCIKVTNKLVTIKNSLELISRVTNVHEEKWLVTL
jgi:hypothetical protein